MNDINEADKLKERDDEDHPRYLKCAHCGSLVDLRNMHPDSIKPNWTMNYDDWGIYHYGCAYPEDEGDDFESRSSWFPHDRRGWIIKYL